MTTGVAGTSGAAGTTGTSRGGTTGTAGTTGTTGTAGISGSVLFMDDFETGTEDKWTWSGDATHAVSTDGSHVYSLNSTMTKLSIAAAGLTTWTNQVAQARMKIISFNGQSTSYLAGLCVRLTDANHYYYLAIQSDGKLKIKVNNSGNSSLSSGVDSGVALGTWFTAKLSAVGSTLTAYINGVMVAQVSDSTLTAGGVGLTVENANTEFDDVVVTAP